MLINAGQHCAGVGCAHDPEAGTTDGTPRHRPRFAPRHARLVGGRHERFASRVEPADPQHPHDRDALLG